MLLHTTTLRFFGIGEQFIIEGAAIEHQCVPGCAEDGDELIHDAAAGANIFVFGGLTKFYELETGNFDFGDRSQSESQARLPAMPRNLVLRLVGPRRG